jgi:hypothetical protein
MELFSRIIPLQRGKSSIGRISRALEYEKRPQGSLTGKTLGW